MNINSEKRIDIAFHLNYLKNLDINSYKIESINFSTKEILFRKPNDSNTYKFNFDEIECQKNMSGESTLDSDVFGKISENNSKINLSNEQFSETSENTQIPQTQQTQQTQPQPLTGGNGKNIFKSLKYSETSSFKANDMSNYSKTSSVMYNDRSDNFSDTSVLGQIGGGLESTDTLMSISELKDRKNKSKVFSSGSSKSNLDIGIFKKTQFQSQNQSGGSKSNIDFKKKMAEVGINSSSTSSICE